MYQSSISNPLMSITGIQGHLLEVTAVGCYKLKDTEWISRQDPYICLEYANTKFSTRTCTDGGKNPTFQEKFTISLIEGLRELNAVVWNSNTLTFNDFIGSAKIQLHKVLSEGYDDCSWPLQTKKGRHAGEVRLILHYANAKKSATSYAPSAPPYVAPYPPQVSMYSTPPPAAYGTPYPPPTNAFAALLPYGLYPTSPAAYPANPYPPQPATYTSPYHQPSAYPPPPYPPPPHASSYYPPGPFPGIYPPPMY